MVCIYNDAGDKIALKVFKADEDYDSIELGTSRKISILRILCYANGHPNIVEMVDIQTPGKEDFVDGNLCMVMPLYKMGDLRRAVSMGLLARVLPGGSRDLKLLMIIHCDIKSDTVNITLPKRGGDRIVPVFVDFSLAKFIGGKNALLPPVATHTGSMSTPTYRAPEVVSKEK
ncbi:hypothetical protein ACHAWX_001799 [Stephanocyclus meneghinianus]